MHIMQREEVIALLDYSKEVNKQPEDSNKNISNKLSRLNSCKNFSQEITRYPTLAPSQERSKGFHRVLNV